MQKKTHQKQVILSKRRSDITRWHHWCNTDKHITRYVWLIAHKSILQEYCRCCFFHTGLQVGSRTIPLSSLKKANVRKVSL